MLLVDTSVWSLAFRRDVASIGPEVVHLRGELASGGGVATTGLVLQEVLTGFAGPKRRDELRRRLTVRMGWGQRTAGLTQRLTDFVS